MAAISRLSNFKLLCRNPVIRPASRTCYFVVLPESPPDTPESDALLRTKELVDFKSVTVRACYDALAKLSLENESSIWKLEKLIKEKDGALTLDEVMKPLEELGARLDAVWGVAKTLHITSGDAMPSDSYRIIHNKGRKARALKFQSRPIYEACKKLLAEAKDPVAKRLLSKFVLEGRLNGGELSESAMKIYTQSMRKTEEERTQFQSKVTKARQLFSQPIIEPSVARDFPSELLRATAVDRSAPSRGPWKVSLEPHIMQPFLQHCPDPELRQNVWWASRTMCSPGQNKEVTTSLNLEEIRFQRREQAKLLGYATYADLSMETKMAGSVDAVRRMIDVLLEKALVAQTKELESLDEFAAERGFEGQLQPWDVPYWRRKQRASLFQYEEGEIREFLPLPRVLQGLMSLMERMLGIRLEEMPLASTWNDDVVMYAVHDAATQRLIGHLYFDAYARPGRKVASRDASSWMMAVRGASPTTGHTPVAAVVLNLTPPLHGIPSLLSFDQVRTLFSQMGHAMQHLMTESQYSEIAGLSNLEWDAVQVSSQFFQTWLSDWNTMERISSHFQSGEPLSKETFDQLNKAAVHMIGTDLCHELYLSALDLELYSTKDFWLDVVKRLWPRFHGRFELIKGDAHPCWFVDAVSGNWGAAYYSRLWSRVVASDMFAAFQEEASLERTGRRFRNVVLAHGGAQPSAETFRQFRGRDPSPDALLSLTGLRKPVH